MILTGDEIVNARTNGDVIIEPFSCTSVEPNSYAFHLGDELVEYTVPVIDPNLRNAYRSFRIPEEGYVLEPDRFYLGHTLERIGGLTVTSELFANLSTAAAGMWVQTSAPLGHTGAVISWTIEICVAQRFRAYPRMRLGKICFWRNQGSVSQYQGKYTASVGTITSKMYSDK